MPNSTGRGSGERDREIDLSVVVPLYNEAESVTLLTEGIRQALGDQRSWELLLIDDGSSDATGDRIAELASADPRVRALPLARNYGQTAAMQAGFDLSRGRVVVSMDGDLQNDPADIPRLVEKLEEGFDLVTGYRERRQDRFWTRKVPSWIANRLIRWLSGVDIRDTGCSLKAYRGELVSRLHLYSDLHRFIPAMAVATAGARTAEVPVRHHARQHGESKYGLSRTWKVLLDLLVIKTLRSGRERPLMLAGAVASFSFLASVAFGVVSLVDWLVQGRNWIVFPALTALSFGLAVHVLMLGLLAEAVLYQGNRRIPFALPLMEALGMPRREREKP